MNQNDLERIIQEEKDRLEFESERLLQEFHRLYEAYHPKAGKPFDISELMPEQYVTRKQVQLWSTLEGDDYPEDVKEMLELCVDKVPELKEARSVVAYGPGSGKNTALIYNFFNSKKESKKGNLYLIDLSYEILGKAQKYCKDRGIEFQNIPKINPYFFQELGEIPIITKDSYYKLHEVLGQTLGNFNDPAEILRKIRLNARLGEYVLMGWFDQGPEAYQNKAFEDMNRLLFDRLGYPQEAFGNYKAYSKCDPSDREWNVMTFTVQDVEKEKRKSELLKEKFGDSHVLLPKTELIVARSRRFKEREVINLCENEGLEGVILQEQVLTRDWPRDIIRIEPETAYQKWKAYGNRRYALFKVEELKSNDDSLLNKYPLGLSLGLLLTGFLGGIFFNDSNVVDCDKLTETNTSLICQYDTCLNEKPVEFSRGSREPELSVPRCKEQKTTEEIIMKSKIKEKTTLGSYVIYETVGGKKYKAKIR